MDRLTPTLIKILFLFFTFIGTSCADQGQIKTKTIADVYKTSCAACHGKNGEGIRADNSPSIASLDSWYIERQLKNFNKGIRESHPSDQILESDIASLSTFISGLPVTAQKNEIEGNAATGQALYGVCAACHGVDAKGNQALSSPNLTVIQDWYLVLQLKNFKSGTRGFHSDDTFGRQMQPMAVILIDNTAISNVTAYIMSL